MPALCSVRSAGKKKKSGKVRKWDRMDVETVSPRPTTPRTINGTPKSEVFLSQPKKALGMDPRSDWPKSEHPLSHSRGQLQLQVRNLFQDTKKS